MFVKNDTMTKGIKASAEMLKMLKTSIKKMSLVKVFISAALNYTIL